MKVELPGRQSGYGENNNLQPRFAAACSRVITYFNIMNKAREVFPIDWALIF
uniref:ORF51 n=1 Tax=Saccharolobus islandicus TaxID=43080 RepID=Q9C4W2_SACIS|nr:ORF51 [Sulfolobus islandicus]